MPARNGPGSAEAAGPDGEQADRPTRRRGARGRSHRRSRTDTPGSARLRRTAFGTAGLLCLVLGAAVALSGQRGTPVVRVETSARDAGDPRAAATAPVTGGGAAPGTVPAAAPVAAPRPFAASPPTRLIIPTAKVDAPVTALGLNADGTVEVPSADRAGETGWYRNGPTPGETGPAVLIGHYDTAHGPAVFHDLPKLRPGDPVRVQRADGSTVEFRVRTLLQAAKDRFPTETVYGNTAAPELRLITCGGRIGSDGHWTDNIIVLADLAGPAG